MLGRCAPHLPQSAVRLLAKRRVLGFGALLDDRNGFLGSNVVQRPEALLVERAVVVVLEMAQPWFQSDSVTQRQNAGRTAIALKQLDCVVVAHVPVLPHELVEKVDDAFGKREAKAQKKSKLGQLAVMLVKRLAEPPGDLCFGLSPRHSVPLKKCALVNPARAEVKDCLSLVGIHPAPRCASITSKSRRRK